MAKQSRTEKEVFIRDLYVWRAYLAPNFSYTKAAKAINVHRTTIYAAIRRVQIRLKVDQQFEKATKGLHFANDFEIFKQLNNL